LRLAQYFVGLNSSLAQSVEELCHRYDTWTLLDFDWFLDLWYIHTLAANMLKRSRFLLFF